MHLRYFGVVKVEFVSSNSRRLGLTVDLVTTLVSFYCAFACVLTFATMFPSPISGKRVSRRWQRWRYPGYFLCFSLLNILPEDWLRGGRMYRLQCVPMSPFLSSLHYFHFFQITLWQVWSMVQRNESQTRQIFTRQWDETCVRALQRRVRRVSCETTA